MVTARWTTPPSWASAGLTPAEVKARSVRCPCRCVAATTSRARWLHSGPGYRPGVEPSDWIAAVSGLLGALVGAGAGYLAAVRAAKRAGAAAWAANTMTVARGLLDSDDPVHRDLGSRLLEASVGAIADAEDTPDRIKQATRGVELTSAFDQVRTLEDGDGDVAVELEDGEGTSA